MTRDELQTEQRTSQIDADASSILPRTSFSPVDIISVIFSAAKGEPRKGQRCFRNPRKLNHKSISHRYPIKLRKQLGFQAELKAGDEEDSGEPRVGNTWMSTWSNLGMTNCHHAQISAPGCFCLSDPEEPPRAARKPAAPPPASPRALHNLVNPTAAESQQGTGFIHLTLKFVGRNNSYRLLRSFQRTEKKSFPLKLQGVSVLSLPGLITR